MKADSLSPVIEMPFGCNILELAGMREFTPVTFEMARPELENELFRRKTEVEYSKWVENLREQFVYRAQGESMPRASPSSPRWDRSEAGAPAPARHHSSPDCSQRTIKIQGAREHNLRDHRRRAFPAIKSRRPHRSRRARASLRSPSTPSMPRASDATWSRSPPTRDSSSTRWSKPDVESIDGLSPAISIEQKTRARTRAPPWGPSTEIADYLRLLYSRVGEPHCHGCGKPPSRGRVLSEMVDACSRPAGEGARVQILAPIVRGRKGDLQEGARRAPPQGLHSCAPVDGEMRDLADEIKPGAIDARHDLDVVIDRLLVKRRRAQPASRTPIEAALKLSGGLSRCRSCGLRRRPGEHAEEWLLSRHRACVECGISFPEIAPSLFSFNNPERRLPAAARASASSRSVDAEERIVPDPSLSLAEGAIEPWSRGPGRRYYRELLASLAATSASSSRTPWRELPAARAQGILLGTGKSGDRLRAVPGP